MKFIGVGLAIFLAFLVICVVVILIAEWIKQLENDPS